MTDNEIIKALECCVIDNSCSKCPHYNVKTPIRECLETSIKGAIDLINRQKAEIESLEALNKCYYTSCQQIAKSNHEIKVEAIKELAERLKGIDLYKFIEKYYENAELCYEVRKDLFEEHIDNLVKEMVGDNDANE